MTVFDLWLPILLTGLATHVASFLAWMVLPHHKPDWIKLAAEDDLLDFLDEHKVPAKQYLFPFCEDPKQMNSPEFVAKMNTRSRGYLVLWPHPPSMGKSISLTLAYFFVAAFLIGYIASIAFQPGEANKMHLFALTFTAGILCHALGPFPACFWFPQKVAMQVVDGVVFALITAALFTWLWPGVGA